MSDNIEEKNNKLKQSIKEKAISLFSPTFIMAFIVSVLYGIYYYPKLNFISLFDTGSYDIAADRILSGKLDLLRTPLYPLFLALCKGLGGVTNLALTGGIIQIVFYYISIYFFYKTLEYFIKSKWMLFFATITYGCSTIIINYNVMLLTETFSIAGLVIFIYLLTQYLQKASTWLIVTAIYLVFALTMLRPSALFLYAVIAAFCVLYFLYNPKQRKQITTVAISFGICVVLILGYITINRVQNNYFGISVVSDMNRFYDVVMADVYQKNTDLEMVAEIKMRIANNEGPLGVGIAVERMFSQNDLTRKRISDFNKEAINKNRAKFMKFLVTKTFVMGNNKMLYNSSTDSFKEGVDRDTVVPGDYFAFNISLIYLFVLLEIGVTIIQLKVRRQLPFGSIAIILIALGMLSLNIIAGPAEFHRLNAPLYPLLILLIFKNADAAVMICSDKAECS